MNHTIRTTIRVPLVALALSVGMVSPAAAIPVDEPETSCVVTSRVVDTDAPSGPLRFPVVHVPGQDWLPARRAG